MKGIGKRHNATAGQVSIAFLLARDNDVISIPGTKDVKYVEENFGALRIQLTPEEIKTIRQAITETELTGDQYPPVHMKLLYGDTPELPK